MKRLKHIFAMLLLIAAIQAAGQDIVIESVCVGSTRHYRVEGEQGSNYTWLLYNSSDIPIVLANPGGRNFAETDADGEVHHMNEIILQWDYVGVYKLKIIQETIYNCDTTDQGFIEVYDQPFAIANNPPAICTGDKVNLNNATASNYGSLLWTTSGDGTFDDPTALHTAYNTGPNDQLAGQVQLTLTAFGKGGTTTCTPVSSTVTSTFRIIPKLVINDPAPVCAPETIDLSLAAVTQGSDADLGNFEYFADQMATIPLVNFKTVDRPGTYYIRGTNSYGCSVIQPVNVKFNKLRVPNFASIPDVCLNSVQLLPTSNFNGISGHWQPSINIKTDVEGTFNYTFKVDPGQCAKDTTIAVKVTKSVSPAFAFKTTYCLNEITAPFPTISANGLSGTWDKQLSVSSIGEETYTFTPEAGSCGIPVQVKVTVTAPASPPMFSFAKERCLGSAPFVLPTTSIEGVTGTWDPAVVETNQLGPKNYTFTPSAGQCVQYRVESIRIIEKTTPTFDPIGPFCFGSAPTALPSISKENIAGTWSPAAIATNKSGTTNYTFTPDDACAVPVTIPIEIYEPITVDVKFDPLSVLGGKTQVTVTATGGTGVYTSGTGVFEHSSGTYVFTVKDNAGCESSPKTIYISEPQQFDVEAKVLNPVPCFGGNALIQVTASGGKAPYTYKLTGGKPPYSSFGNNYTYYVAASNIPYQFEVVDADGKFARSNILEITEPPKIELSWTATETSCAGMNDGTATVQATFGQPPYKYAWSNGQTTQTATGLSAGTHRVIVYDQLDCYRVSVDVVISAPSIKTLQASATDPKCHGEPGTVLFTFTNVPDGLYDILYDGGQFNAVKVTSYTATVPAMPGTYANLKLLINGCSTANGVNSTVNPTPALTINAGKVIRIQPDCQHPGTIFIQEPAQGTGYLYSKDNGASFQASSTFPFLNPGNYSLRIKSISSGCVSEPLDEVINPAPNTPTAPVVASITDPDCNTPTGTIALSGLPATGAWKVTASPGGKTITGTGTTATFIGLASNTYTFTVTDEITTCVSAASANAVIKPQPVTPAPPVIGALIQPDCDTPTGSVELSGLPLSGTWIVTASPGGATLTGTGSTATFSGLAPNNYTFTVANAPSTCISAASESARILPPPILPSAPIAGLRIHPDCDTPAGSVELSGLPASGTWTITASPGGATVTGTGTTATFGGLAPNTYTFTVTDGITTCTSAASANVTINVQAKISPPTVSSVTQPNCTTATGSVALNGLPASGTWILTRTPGNITISGTGTSHTVNGLSAGTYTFTVTDEPTSCISAASAEVIINEQPVTTAPVVGPIAQPTCSTTTGSVVLSGLPATGTWILTRMPGNTAISGTGTSHTISGLSSGTYTYTVTDGINSCTSAASAPVIIEPQPVTTPPIIGQITQPGCVTNTGSVQLDGLPDQGGWTLTRSPGNIATNGTGAGYVVTGLSPGAYSFTVTNRATNCTSTASANVVINALPLPPPEPKVLVTKKPTCNDENGIIAVTSPAEGTGFWYSIDGGDFVASPIFENKRTGEYSFRVKNIVTECISDTTMIKVPAIPPAPALSLVSFENPRCFGDTFRINLSMTTTVPPGNYTFWYDGGQFDNIPVANNKATISGVITERVKEFNNLRFVANGCPSTGDPDVRIESPAELEIRIVKVLEQSLKGIQKGAIDIVASGGTGSYKYTWNNGATTEDLEDIAFGNYTVTVSDDKNCTALKEIRVPLNNPPVALADTFTFNCLAVTGDLLENDYDPDPKEQEDFITINTTPVTSPKFAQEFIIYPDGTFSYKAISGYSGIDFFVYEIVDKLGQTATARVNLNVVSDFDGDGLADTDDPDADNDGILNKYEAFAGQDWTTADADGDGLPNYLDIDSDNDGIADNVEAQLSSPAYIRPSNLDVNNNGVDDAYDTFQLVPEIKPVDTDGDGLPDFLDADSDNDGVPDYIEGHDGDSNGRPDISAVGKDSDFDGLDNAYDTVVNECGILGNAVGSDAVLQDTDSDGIPDWRDDNDDDDLYPTKFEDLNADNNWANDDVDFDGIPEYLDYGRECDMFIPDIFTPNADNIHDYFQIYCINHYPNAKMYIFDQVGNKLFEREKYGNLDHWGTVERACWNGRAELGAGRSTNARVPVGTYYYVLDLGNGEVKKSFVYVSY